MPNGARCWITRVGAALLVATGIGCGPHASDEAPAKEPIPRRDFRISPPHVDEVAIQRADSGPDDVRVWVTFAKDERLPSELPLDVDGRRLVLRPESGNRYTGTMRLDLAALVRRQHDLDALRAASGRDLEFPVFEGRELRRRIPIAQLDVARLEAAQKTVLRAAWVTPDEVDAHRTLVVTDPSVLGDCTRTTDACTGAGAPLGKWTFGYLMQQLAGTVDPAVFTKSWLDQWGADQTVNGFTVAKRPHMKDDIVANWPTTASGALDLARAPFRLIAIVNRIDLAENLIYGSGSAGEGRFVFQALGPPPLCRPLDFTVIFEYGIQKAGCSELRDWAQQWVALGTQPFPSAAYNAALEVLTEQFVHPAGALSQLRTNEIALARLGDNTWEMREFHLTGGALVETTVRRTPAFKFNLTQTLADWANANPGTPTSPVDVPRDYPTGMPFLGATGVMDTTDFFWKGPTDTSISPSDARHALSLNTCNGCHARETQTPFTHLKLSIDATTTTSTTLPSTCTNTAAVGTVDLSGFLTGEDVPDPVTGVSRHFGDLDNRRTILASIANRSCLFALFHEPVPMTH